MSKDAHIEEYLCEMQAILKYTVTEKPFEIHRLQYIPGTGVVEIRDPDDSFTSYQMVQRELSKRLNANKKAPAPAPAPTREMSNLTINEAASELSASTSTSTSTSP